MRDDTPVGYTIAQTEDGTPEITLYGDIVSSAPSDYGEEQGAYYITAQGFVQELEKVAKDAPKVCLRIHSLGGEVGTALMIHNRLRELSAGGTKVVGIVDGVAMSAGSLILCACDGIFVHKTSLIMVHKCMSLMLGWYNADEMRRFADTNDAHDKALIAAYQRKTGLSEDALVAMMAQTTYMTGAEAVAKGFADALIEGQAIEIAATADRTALVVAGRTIRLAHGMPLPTTIAKAIPAIADDAHKPHKEDKKMPKTTEELKAAYPELVAQLQAEATAAERERLRCIDEVAAQIDSAVVAQAKYGEQACTAEQMCYRAMQHSAQQARQHAAAASQQGAAMIAALQQDTVDSGANDVPYAHAPQPQAHDTPKTPEQRLAVAKAEVQALLRKNKED